MNRKPQEADCELHIKGSDCGATSCRYHTHERTCGGSYIKTKEPEPPKKKGRSNRKRSVVLTNAVTASGAVRTVEDYFWRTTGDGGGAEALACSGGVAGASSREDFTSVRAAAGGGRAQSSWDPPRVLAAPVCRGSGSLAVGSSGRTSAGAPQKMQKVDAVSGRSVAAVPVREPADPVASHSAYPPPVSAAAIASKGIIDLTADSTLTGALPSRESFREGEAHAAVVSKVIVLDSDEQECRPASSTVGSSSRWSTSSYGQVCVARHPVGSRWQGAVTTGSLDAGRSADMHEKGLEGGRVKSTGAASQLDDVQNPMKTPFCDVGAVPCSGLEIIGRQENEPSSEGVCGLPTMRSPASSGGAGRAVLGVTGDSMHASHANCPQHYRAGDEVEDRRRACAAAASRRLGLASAALATGQTFERLSRER
jgi:hypothetical protein